MTRIKRPPPQEMIAVLRLASRRIENDENTMICVALGHVAQRYPSLDQASDYLQDYIYKKLERDEGSFTVWLKHHGFEYSDPAQRKIYRLRWIDWMISGLHEEVYR